MKIPGNRALLLALALAALLPSCRREGGGTVTVPRPAADQPAQSAQAAQSAQLAQMPPGERASFLLNRGTRFLAEGRNGEAVKVLEMARQTDPSSARIAVELGRAYLRDEKPDRAWQLLEETVDSPTASAEEKTRGREVLVEVLLSMGNLTSAKQACAPLLEGGEVSAVARRLSGMIAYREGDSKRALSELKEAARLAPRDAETRTALGVALLSDGDLPGAAAALEEAVRLDPGSQAAVSNLAKVYERQGRDADAEAARRKLQEIHEARSLRQKAAPLQAKGVEAYNAGRLEEALEKFREVLQMSPREQEALAHAGSTCLALQRLDEAESYLKQALEVLPEDSFALTEMARVRALRDDLPGAIDLLQRAARSDPDAPGPHYFLAGIYYHQGRKEDFLREKAAFDRLRKTTPMPGVMELPEAPGP